MSDSKIKKLIKEELKSIVITEVLKEHTKEYNEFFESIGIFDANVKRDLLKVLLKRDLSVLSEAMTFKDLQKKAAEEGGIDSLKADLKTDKRDDILQALFKGRETDPSIAGRFARALDVSPDDVEKAGFSVRAATPEPPRKEPSGSGAAIRARAATPQKTPEKPKPKAAAPATPTKAEPKSEPATKKAEPKTAAPQKGKKGKKEAPPAAPKKKEPHRGSAKKAKEREREAGQGGGKSDKGPTVPYIHGRKMSPRAKAERERIGKEMLGGGKDNDGKPLPLAGRSKAMRNWSAKKRKAANNRMNRVKEKFKRRAVRFGWPASAWKSFLWAAASDIAIKKYGGSATRSANPISARPKKPKE